MDRSLHFKRTLVLRILRYVSPLPWGSPTAEAGRRTKSLDRIAAYLWGTKTLQTKPFTAGGQVLWSPVIVNSANEIRFSTMNGNKDYRPAWLASRLPPFRGQLGMLAMDISNDLRSNLAQRQVRFLWDNRFLVTCRMEDLDERMVYDLMAGITSVWIKPLNRYFEPVMVSTTAAWLGHVEGRQPDFVPVPYCTAVYEYIRSLESS